MSHLGIKINVSTYINYVYHGKYRCSYTWESQKSFDELAILEHLPGKMRTDVALDVHYKTVKNVKLFHGCDPGLIRELVIKLQPIIFLSGILNWKVN